MRILTERLRRTGFAPSWGPCLIVLGLGFALIAMIEFLATFGIFGPLRLSWCWLVGMPLLIAGLVVCQMEGRGRRRG